MLGQLFAYAQIETSLYTTLAPCHTGGVGSCDFVGALTLGLYTVKTDFVHGYADGLPDMRRGRLQTESIRRLASSQGQTAATLP